MSAYGAPDYTPMSAYGAPDHTPPPAHGVPDSEPIYERASKSQRLQDDTCRGALLASLPGAPDKAAPKA